MSITHNIYIENTDENYVYEPKIGDIVFFDKIWFCRSIVDKIQKLNNGHTLIHVVAASPAAHSGWFNKDKVEINVSPKITWNELYGRSSKEMIDKYIRGGRNYEQ